MLRPRLLFVVIAASAASACRDVSEFSTHTGESFCGPIVRGDFVRAGFGETVRMRLVLDAERLETAPGEVTTSDGLFTKARLRPVPQLFRDPLSTLQFGEGRRRNLLYALDAAPASGSVMTVISLMDNGTVEVRLLRGATAEAAGGGAGGAGNGQAGASSQGRASDTNGAGAAGESAGGMSSAAGGAAGSAAALFGVFSLGRQKGSCGLLVRRPAALATRHAGRSRPTEVATPHARLGNRNLV